MSGAHLLLLLAEQGAFKAQHFGNVQVVFAQRVQTLRQVVNEHQDESPDQFQGAGDALEDVFCRDRTVKRKLSVENETVAADFVCLFLTFLLFLFFHSAFIQFILTGVCSVDA